MQNLHAHNIKIVFGGGGHDNIKLVTNKDKIVIPQKLQIYVVLWYHA